MLGPVLTVLGTLTHLILLIVLANWGRGRAIIVLLFLVRKQTVTQQGWVARHFNLKAKLYTSVLSAAPSPRAQDPKALWVSAV